MLKNPEINEILRLKNSDESLKVKKAVNPMIMHAINRIAIKLFPNIVMIPAKK